MKNMILRAMLPAVCVIAVSFSVSLPVAGMTGAPQAPTADSQKNNKTDVDLTANIRKAIMADKTLSTSAHNVKIIAEHGKVTLRGSVHSQDEKDAVLAKAKDAAGADNVVDDVKISPPKKAK